MAKLDAIQLYIGLPLNIDPNERKNKFECHISKKCGQNSHLMASASLSIFHPILTNEYTKMISSSRQIE